MINKYTLALAFIVWIGYCAAQSVPTLINITTAAGI